MSEEKTDNQKIGGIRRQFIISIVALGITIILWGVFIVMNILD
jgi:hypothetical protein